MRSAGLAPPRNWVEEGIEGVERKGEMNYILDNQKYSILSSRDYKESNDGIEIKNSFSKFEDKASKLRGGSNSAISMELHEDKHEILSVRTAPVVALSPIAAADVTSTRSDLQNFQKTLKNNNLPTYEREEDKTKNIYEKTDKKHLFRSLTRETDVQSTNDEKKTILTAASCGTTDSQIQSKQIKSLTFIDFIENHQSSWAVFTFYIWYLSIFVFSIIVRIAGMGTPRNHPISPFEVLRLVSLIPICLHLYRHFQKYYYPSWKPQPFRLWQIGDLFIFLVTTISALVLFYSSITQNCSMPLCVTGRDGLQTGLLLQSVIIAILAPILVKAHSTWWVVISYFISFAFTLTSAIVKDHSATTLFTVTIMYSLGSIVLYDNERTLRILYINYVNHEDNLLMKLKTTNEKELLSMKGEELRYLIGNVAHDLKSPLHGFSLELETLRKRLVNDSESLESIVALRRICSFLLMTINRAIDYSKASSGMLNVETVDLNEAMDWVVKCVSPLNELPIKIDPLPNEMCSTVITDKHWLTENLLCLVSNAQKFTGEGQISIRCSLENIPINEDHARGSLISGWLTPLPSKSNLVPHADSNLAIQTHDLFIPFQSSSQTLSTNHMVRIEVEDSGIGIRPEERSELFQPFKQAQRRVGGTGLGLYSLCKRVEALGGSCGVNDRRDGGSGSLFWFTFPYRPDESATLLTSPRLLEASSESFETQTHDTPGHKEIRSTSPKIAITRSLSDTHFTAARIGDHSPSNHRILLVEDSVLIQKTTSRALTKEGYTVDIARNGLECLKMVQEHEYSFILMDIQMPVMDGIEATRRLREMECKSAADTVRAALDHEKSSIDSRGSIEWTKENSQEYLDLSDQRYDSMENGTNGFVDLSGKTIRSLFQKRISTIIIGLSANSDNVTREEALEAGMNEFLSKPLTISRLQKCLERFQQDSSQRVW